MLIKIWKDPVWSKVIATGITGLIGFLVYTFVPRSFINSLWQLISSPSVPNGVLVLVCFIIIVCMFILLKERGCSKSKAFSSKEWFREICEKLMDCAYARIYLRSFDHPDDFRDEHRDALMEIMNTIKIKIQSDADIKIISFNPNKGKSGVDWLSAELKNDGAISKAIQIRTTQPVANATSMYLFDDKSVIYNRKGNGNTTFHVENYSNSIIHEFIKRGFDDLERTK